MKLFNVVKVITATLFTSLILTEAITAQTPVIPVSRNLSPDPLTVSGTSNQTATSNCGNVTNSPNQVIRVREALPYMRVTAKSPGRTTLVVDGPGGRFCVMADSSPGSQAELAGLWQAGDYSIKVGNLSQTQFNYTLEISQQKK